MLVPTLLLLAAAPPGASPVHAMGVECNWPPHPALMASYFSDLDYPLSAIGKREQGTVEFCVRIGLDGLVSDCAVLRSSGFADLDEATCAIARARMRFTPAHDAGGRTVEDGVISRVRWVLPHAPSPKEKP
jgi:protein TonB